MASSPGSTATDPADRLILALDFPAAAPALALASRLEGSIRWVKVGLELYLSAGQQIVEDLLRRDLYVFLDLKLHDIPNTVGAAVRAISGLGVSLLTVHALGGPAMLAAAAEAASAPESPRLLAVTVLTSMDQPQLSAIGISVSPLQAAVSLARVAHSSGITGLVCSPEEAAAMRAATPGMHIVTPGIRPAGAAAGDQRRFLTPAAALRAGSSQLVVGRPITQAADPEGVTQAILGEIAESLR